ncbi:MAG: 5'-nucleotidase C-terminal domain-containing protein, partial [Methanomicrobiaceae archaeon]|nr:5'-nucleotidase C-terminal domain-containing protein [Methanomicrobiaceae archaeon]
SIINDTVIIQSGCHGSFAGRLDLVVDDRKVTGVGHELIVVDASVTPDPGVQELVDRTMDPHRDYLEEVVGRTETPLDRNTVMEATMDNLLLQSLLDLTGAQMAFSNGWRYGAPVPPGAITRNDLWNIIPVNPPVSTVELTGREVWTMMEENLERTFSRDPYLQMGGYVKRCMGINVYFKVENPAGQRIQELYVQGERVRPDARYTAAYVTSQGVPEQYGRQREHCSLHAIEALERYIEKGSVHADLRGSVVPI